MFTVLGLGFLLGLQHAMEADHVAAVAALAAGGKRLRQAARHGLYWGLGHALSLGAFAALVVMAALMAWLKRSTYTPFVIYRICLGGFVLAVVYG